MKKFVFTKAFAAKAVLAIGGLILIANFQNCAGSSNPNYSDAGPWGNSSAALDCSNNSSAVGCAPTDCEFNGAGLASGASVTAYQNSSTPFGNACVSETRTCQNGALSGSFAFASCNVGAPASCLFDGQTIAHDASITAFQNSSVPFGSTCVSESRKCSDGALSGSYSYQTCVPAAPNSCLFNGQTIAHGETVAAFSLSTVPHGSTCQQQDRVCNNGVLSGDAEFASCNVQAPQSCLFNGQTVAHGQAVDAFLSSSVAFGEQCAQESRVCDNGVLSGSNTFASCNVDAPKSCLFNGVTVAHGEIVQSFLAASVPYGNACEQQARTCNNGVLSGSYANDSCVVLPAANCSLAGQDVAHQSTILAFQTAEVPYSGICVSETRSCDNGQLSGSFENLSCGKAPPASCSFNNQLVASGQTVQAYASVSVPYGTTCTAETRSCLDGLLSGSYENSSCSVQPPANCVFNGSTVLHGASVTGYKSATAGNNGKCESQTRTCTNGSLSGSFAFGSCK